MNPPSTCEEFERQYARRSHVTVDWLHAEGLYGEPCDCGDAMCEGWQMKHRDKAERAEKAQG